jgi:hypothetical protein
VQFLIEHFTFLGFEGQYWMLIVVALIAAFILFVWKTRDRIWAGPGQATTTKSKHTNQGSRLRLATCRRKRVILLMTKFPTH